MNEMTNNFFDNTFKTPLTEITDKELDIIILKLGSFFSIISNKKSNQAKLLLATINDKNFQELFLRLADIDNLQSLVTILIHKYPTISKSKVILNNIVHDN